MSHYDYNKEQRSVKIIRRVNGTSETQEFRGLDMLCWNTTHPSVLTATVSSSTLLIAKGRTAVLSKGGGGKTRRYEERGTHD